MFGCVIALLLINTFYSSFGYPVKESYVPLGKSLQLLTNNCDDKFLASQILNKVDACNISLSAEGEITERELECLIFYDINTQLCTALRGSKLNASKSFDSRMNQTQKVDATCRAALKNWKFTNLTHYPKYYNTSEKVFKTTVICLKACGVQDILSEDTNFFCKYYQWGSELLEVTNIPLTVNVVSGESAAGTISVGSASTSPSIAPKLNDNSKEPQPQVESPSLSAKDDSDNPENVPSTNSTQLDQHRSNVLDAGVLKKNTSTITKSVINKGVPANNLAIQSKPGNTQMDPDENQLSDNFNDDVADDGNELDPPDDALPHDPIDEDDPHLEPEKTQKQKNGAAILSSPNGGMLQREMYSNTIPNQFAEDDDHFFSFFLTAIILVIFLYVLYHNKSKFRKVILGLLVEGRQSGRRRNSRGHEYRRLDTLEQAMSANSTAPPSKIIY